MANLLILSLEFMKTGLFAVGGGLATIPFLKEIGINYNLFNLDFIIKMIAISESTPGPIGINMASYIGAHYFDIFGAIILSISLILPSIVIIIIIAMFLEKFKSLKIIEHLFKLLRPAVVALITSILVPIAIMSFWLNQQFVWINMLIVVILFMIYHYFKLHPILMIIIGMFIGYILKI